MTQLNRGQTSEYYKNLLYSAITHAKAKEFGSARRYLERILDGMAELPIKSEAAYWMARTSATRSDAMNWLEESLGMNPAHGEARRALLILKGKLDQKKIIDPNRLPELDPETHLSMGDRFECPQCGSRMVFAPDGVKLYCEHCGYKPDALDKTGFQETDFAMGIAIAEGHQHAVAMQSFECVACGATYLLDSKTTTITCAHCDAVYNITKRETVELFPPEAIAPFQTDRGQALKAARGWLKKESIEKVNALDVKGVYLPIWTFDIGGAMNWNCLVYDPNKETWIPKNGTKAVFFDDILIPASSPMSESLANTLVKFNKEDLIVYKPGYTANWLAETYKVTMSDAAIDARAFAAKNGRKIIERDIFGQYKDLNGSSTGLVIETFKLALLPIWIGHYEVENTEYEIILKGTDLEIEATAPAKGFKKLVNWLLEKEE